MRTLRPLLKLSGSLRLGYTEKVMRLLMSKLIKLHDLFYML